MLGMAKTELQKINNPAGVNTKEPAEKLLLRKLVVDIRTWGTHWKQGKEYMEFHLKRSIGESTYFQYLKDFDSDPEIQAWIDYQARAGFIINQRNMLERALTLADKFATLLDDEIKGKARPGVIMGYSQQLGNWNKRVDELNLGNPIVATIKYMIDHAGEKKEIEKREPLRAVI